MAVTGRTVSVTNASSPISTPGPNVMLGSDFLGSCLVSFNEPSWNDVARVGEFTRPEQDLAIFELLGFGADSDDL